MVVGGPPIFVLMMGCVFSFLYSGVAGNECEELLRVIMALPVFLCLSCSYSFRRIPASELSVK